MALDEMFAEIPFEISTFGQSFKQTLLTYSPEKDRSIIEALLTGNYQTTRVQGTKAVKRFLMKWAELAEKYYSESPMRARRSLTEVSENEIILKSFIVSVMGAGIYFSELSPIVRLLGYLGCTYYLLVHPYQRREEQKPSDASVQIVPPKTSRARRLFSESLSAPEKPHVVLAPNGDVIALSKQDGELTLTFISAK